jgi:hypothetical protein
MYATLAAKTQASRRNYAEMDRNTPTVFILGFGGTKSAFVRDLLKYPDFGFISMSEKEELQKRQKTAESGLPDDVRHLKEYYAMLKKRITSKSKDGFFKFFGYDEFVNKLFMSDNIKLTDLETIAISKLKSGEAVTLEDIIREQIRLGNIQVNSALLDMFKNSLVICDEIHNTYNMNMKNNRGVAIQFLLDSVPSLRFLSLSATPINNSPTEVVELVNYLVLPDQKITKKGFFANSRTLLPGKLIELGVLLKGRISFLQDINVKYYPRREIIGTPITIPHDVDEFRAGSVIPYLKFSVCLMSKFHQDTYNNHLRNGIASAPDVEKQVGNPVETATELLANETPLDEIKNVVESNEDSGVKVTGINDDAPDPEDVQVSIDAPVYAYHSIPTDGYSIYDIAFPSPDTTEHGIFRSGDVRTKLTAASQKWRDEYKISLKKFSALNSIITGDFLLRGNISKYSTKYARILELIDAIFDEYGTDNNDTDKGQKVMIYHDRVKMSGVLLIQELLKTNGFADEHSEPIANTRCCICGDPLSAHVSKSNKTHEYRPARFIVAHSDIDKTTMGQSLNKFNMTDNAHGMNFMVLIGSKIIKESYDFKDIQNLIITSLPINIPTLLQVFGRSIRKASHINLPPAQRRVRIQILISMINTSYTHSDAISPEMYRYIDKLYDYIVIQNIEREMYRNAVDADIHRDIIMPPALLAEYFPNGQNDPVDTLGNLYFEPAVRIDPDKITLSTFTAYKHYEGEIKTISFVIKRLFMITAVWTYDKLWSAVQAPPFGLEVNPKMFSEDNFIIALHNLVSAAKTIISGKKAGELTDAGLLDKLFDPNERFIYANGKRSKIEQVGEYYILFPVMDMSINPLNAVYMESLEYTRDKERALMRDTASDRILVDVETYIRSRTPQKGIKINIDDFIQDSRANLHYIAKKKKFIAEYATRDDIVGFLSDFSDRFQMSLLEEAIIWSIEDDESVTNALENPTHTLYVKVIDLFDKFNVLIYVNEVRKYKDITKQYKNGLPIVANNVPIGYTSTKSVKLYDITDKQWLEVSKISLNRQVTYKENEIIIGYLESAEDHMKFKIRKSMHKIKSELASHKSKKSETSKSDTRLIERGIVCSTKNKTELLNIISQLGISVSSLDKGDIRIKKLCEIIKQRLIVSELKERSKESRYKYLYSWWDKLPELSSM